MSRAAHYLFGMAALAGLAGCGKREEVPPPPAFVRIGSTGSMRPTFVGGEVRKVIPTPYAELQPGDIALHYWEGKWHPHRLVSRQLGRWITQGEASARPDQRKMTEESYGGTILP